MSIISSKPEMIKAFGIHILVSDGIAGISAIRTSQYIVDPQAIVRYDSAIRYMTNGQRKRWERHMRSRILEGKA